MRAIQRLTKETALLFILPGIPLLLMVSLRRSLFILMVPAYYLLLQSPMHLEFRYTLPMQYFMSRLEQSHGLRLTKGTDMVRSGITRSWPKLRS